ncbi:glycosyltransferase family 2 protein [Gluconobacter sp. Dm-73]|uniref:glycosyltransferase family 2 protein n=1 Tax=Gluconobacter sp. Dm-73 TaxID=2799802 RepID=UPI001B8CAD10|nr:glycosyltransferase family A protein [Gluconobacter sp. Dm-73]MBS1075352.1 glycosyltransferase family 2 protein [Gluconobacter sp. Dm-73]
MAGKLGIGIITYNRKDILLETIQNIFRFTKVPFDFVVADDGSSDGTQKTLKEMRITCVTGDNRGIAWNRNRAIWYLKNERKCDNIIIFEDDCKPVEFGWEQQWIDALESFGHINYMPEITIEIDNDISSGSGTAVDPYIAPMHQALCVGYHAKALDYVGFLDVRFKKYGEEHVEHTHRFLRAGYGGLPQYLTPERGQVYYLRGGLSVMPSESHGDHEIASYNQRVHEEIKKDPIYRSPWRTDEQMFLFREEINSSLNRPSTNNDFEDKEFDSIISLGGDHRSSLFVESFFHKTGPDLFGQFITPFHTLISLFETNFEHLLSTVCLYGYYDALRCRETLLIYHKNINNIAEPAERVGNFVSNIDDTRKNYRPLIEKMDSACDGSKKVLFVRDWRDSYLYAGSHRPEGSNPADFQRLIKAISARYPNLDFKVLFVNFGSSAKADPRMLFYNTDVPDICEVEREQEAWNQMFRNLNISCRIQD